jgi:plasmid maintenance system antidote protein VapI
MARGRRKFRQHRRLHQNVIMAGLRGRYGTGRAIARHLEITPMYVSLLARGQRPLTTPVAAKIRNLP